MADDDVVDSYPGNSPPGAPEFEPGSPEEGAPKSPSVNPGNRPPEFGPGGYIEPSGFGNPYVPQQPPAQEGPPIPGQINHGFLPGETPPNLGPNDGPPLYPPWLSQPDMDEGYRDQEVPTTGPAGSDIIDNEALQEKDRYQPAPTWLRDSTDTLASAPAGSVIAITVSTDGTWMNDEVTNSLSQTCRAAYLAYKMACQAQGDALLGTCLTFPSQRWYVACLFVHSISGNDTNAEMLDWLMTAFQTMETQIPAGRDVHMPLLLGETPQVHWGESRKIVEMCLAKGRVYILHANAVNSGPFQTGV